MRGVTVAIVAGAVVVLVAAALYLRPRVEPAPDVAAHGAGQPVPQQKAMERSARVEERLGQLRDEFEKRQGGIAKVEPNRREVPTMSAQQREAMERSEDSVDDLDLEDPEEMQQLKHTLLSDPDPEERIGAVLMLTGEEGPESLRMLLEAMGDPDAEVRLAVVEALGDRSEELTPDTLTPALRDSDPEVRFEAVSILGDMESPEAQQMVRSATHDEDEDVRALAEGIEDFSDDGEDQANAVPTPRPGQPRNVQPQSKH
jgi:hypothetical protein